VEFDIDWGTVDLAATHGLGYLDLLCDSRRRWCWAPRSGWSASDLSVQLGSARTRWFCVASALIMIVSTYGFPQGEVFNLDPSRIAAQVVSGIGFLAPA